MELHMQLLHMVGAGYCKEEGKNCRRCDETAIQHFTLVEWIGKITKKLVAMLI